MGGRTRTVRCSRCGVQLVVPPSARTIRCAICHGITNVGSRQDPVRQAVGFVKSMVNSLNPLLSYGSGGSSMSYGFNSSNNNSLWNLPPGYPPAQGKKRALLIGVSYRMRRYELKGTVNDVNCMRYLLCERLGFPSECVLVLTEAQVDPYRIPTKENIRMAMRWLMMGCQAGDSLVFHFSGHGIQKPDTNGDEVDGYDEALCPLDFETSGVIVDDEVNETLVRPLPRGAKLHAVVDACHSGTILDLPYLCRFNRGGFYQWEDHRPPSGVYKGTSGGLAVLISGCDDHQTSADTNAFAGSTSTGAMTYSFIQALEFEPGTTYGRLLTSMRSAIRDANTGIGSGPIASLLSKVFGLGLTQEPQLSSSEMFDIYRKPFLL
ncbi:metacaspase-1 isoform X2 [Elaeis guineensis]|uniref:Metacaspase-1 n=1 Tax=Elaeis guineensis var. tenera TaxID=51953 RepID=A0A6I9QZ12_ELAGV|nr:metacaspase-1 [Elaeis guineensis]XP_029119333.1 metacaspase-1 [Elaeis guineensis]